VAVLGAAYSFYQGAAKVGTPSTPATPLPLPGTPGAPGTSPAPGKTGTTTPAATATTPATAGKPAVAPIGMIELTIEKGTNLLNVDLTGKDNKSDPYAEVMVGLHKQKTKAVKNNLNPEWNFPCMFEVDLNDAKKGVLSVTLWDERDGFLDWSKRKSLGHVDINISDVWGIHANEKKQKSFDLEGEKGQKHGSIMISGLYKPKGLLPAPVPLPSVTEGTLVLHVEKATDLPNVDTGAQGLSDPYAEVTVGSTKIKTNTVMNNLSPVWKEQTMQFPVDLRDKKKGVLSIHVWDQKDDSEEYKDSKSLGTLELVILDVWGKTPGKPLQKPFELVSDLPNGGKCGKIYLNGEFHPKATTSAGAPATPGAPVTPGAPAIPGPVPGTPAPIPGTPAPTAGTLRLLIEKANNLPSVASKSGAKDVPDPYAEAIVGKSKHATAKLCNDANPVWKNEKTFDFSVDLKANSPTGKLVIHVWDGKQGIFDFSGTHSLGTVEIDLSHTWGNTPNVEVSKEFTLETETEDATPHSTITLKGTFIPKPPPKPPVTKPSSTKLNNFTLSVDSASSLTNLEKTGVSDPYAIVTLAGQSKKSETIKENLNPVWTKLKGLHFSVDLKDTKKSTLHIEVWDDKDSLFGKKEMIGSVDIDLAKSEWKAQEGKELPQNIDIMSNKQKAGTIHLKGKLDP